MSARSGIPSEVTARQMQASDPRASIWVSANAGSGKTHVLSQRVIRLLLHGCDPAKILCLTFTKAAAANMANRIFEILGNWTALDDAALDQQIMALDGPRRPDAGARQRARRLFAEALETPGGLKVQTIHAFCTALLHQFPFEADVAARFEVMEERAEQELIDRLRLEVLLEAAQSPQSALGQALQRAIVAATDVTFADVVREAIGERDAVEGWIGRAGGVDEAIAELSVALGVRPGETQETIEAAFFGESPIPRSEWDAIAAICASGRTSDREHAERLARASRGHAWEHAEAYLDVFCTQKLKPRDNVLTAGLRNKHPELVAMLQAEQQRLCALIDRRRAIMTRDRTAALIRIAHAVMTRYRVEKQRRGLLDYDDLIDKTLALLSRDGSAAWVMYKLDLGVDHVLIDEAQDTSPKQWEIVRRLTEEFTAGESARRIRRTVFAVGDEKQSIYSFQGAAPHAFDEMRKHFVAAHRDAELAFEKIEFKYSFRSGPNILGAVDAVFARAEAYKGLTADPVATLHEAVRRDAPGFVEIWEPEKPDEKAEIQPWDAPFDLPSEREPRVRLANRIAASVRELLASGEALPSTNRRATARDVLILVRQRGPLFAAIIRALKTAGLPVAGADRLVLTEHIAIMDLLVLADALLLPDDDLALATVLKSPLFGLSEEQLFALACERSGSLRRSLREKAGLDAAFAEANRKFEALAELSRSAGPFAFYAHLLGRLGGRRQIYARLGLEAADALDEFLSLALDYEARHTPSLQGFVAWLRATASEVKRDMDIVRDEIRVMTVHGAKGLEAGVVILADTMTKPAGPYEPRILTLDASGLPSGAVPPLVWAGRKDDDVPPVGEARERAHEAAKDEHRRLLYVAMTRAADRLVVAAAENQKRPPDGCWYHLVRQALEPEAVRIGEGEQAVWRWEKFVGVEPALPERGEPEPAVVSEEDTAWLSRDAAPVEQAPLSLSPSRAYAAAIRGVGGDAEGLVRGRLMHRLLQSLPDVVPENRAAAAQRFLARHAAVLGEDAREMLAAEALRVIADPAFAPVFAPGSRAEVPIAARLARADGSPLPVSGQIDRLAVTADAVLIVDYKTDRDPPAAVPPAYVAQLALYRAVLREVYPRHAVRAAVLWTDRPGLVEIPGALLERALAEMLSGGQPHGRVSAA